MLPSIFDLGQHIMNFRSKIFNNDLDASHYLYNVHVLYFKITCVLELKE